MFQLLNLEISYSKYISVYTISPYSASCRHRSAAQLNRSGLRCCGSVEMMQAELQHKHRHSTAAANGDSQSRSRPLLGPCWKNLSKHLLSGHLNMVSIRHNMILGRWCKDHNQQEAFSGHCETSRRFIASSIHTQHCQADSENMSLLLIEAKSTFRVWFTQFFRRRGNWHHKNPPLSNSSYEGHSWNWPDGCT